MPVIKFPDIAGRDDRVVRELIADHFQKQGVAGSLATKLSAEIWSDFREFERRVNGKTFAFHTTTDAEVQLLQDASRQVADACKEIWLEQRFEIELRRLGL